VFTFKGCNLSKWRTTSEEWKAIVAMINKSLKNVTKEVKVLAGLMASLKGWKPSKDWISLNKCTFKDLQISGHFPYLQKYRGVLLTDLELQILADHGLDKAKGLETQLSIIFDNDPLMFVDSSNKDLQHLKMVAKDYKTFITTILSWRKHIIPHDNAKLTKELSATKTTDKKSLLA